MLEGLDTYVERALKDWNVPGVAIAIVRDDKVLRAQGFGVRESGKPDRVDEHTQFQIGSCGKAFTAAALAMLVHDGKLAWDEPIVTYMPPLAVADADRITTRDLLLNRSGVPGLDAGETTIWLDKPLTRDQVLAHIGDLKGWPLRERFDYSNVGYLAAGKLVSAITQTSWDDFIRTRIFAPLGMTRSRTTTRSLEAESNAALAHAMNDGTIQSAPWLDLNNVGPAGAIVSTATDMAQWLRFQLTNAVVEETHKPGIDVEDPEWRLLFPAAEKIRWAMGWATYEYRGEQLVEHDGLVPGGMHAAVSLMPARHIGIVVLSNVDFMTNRVPEALRYWIYDALLGGHDRDWSRDLLTQVMQATAQSTAG